MLLSTEEISRQIIENKDKDNIESNLWIPEETEEKMLCSEENSTYAAFSLDKQGVRDGGLGHSKHLACLSIEFKFSSCFSAHLSAWFSGSK